MWQDPLQRINYFNLFLSGEMGIHLINIWELGRSQNNFITSVVPSKFLPAFGEDQGSTIFLKIQQLTETFVVNYKT